MKHRQQDIKHRTPDEWLAVIETIPMPTRALVAKIVWWDYFSNRLAEFRWPHLDDYLNSFSRLAAYEPGLFDALIKCGYSERNARQRSLPAKQHRNYKPRRKIAS